jgi:hypothetical protein
MHRLLLCLLLFHCCFKSFAQTPQKGNLVAIQATVLDSSSGLPLQNASVTLKGSRNFNGLTDARGHFLIDHLPGGTYSITIAFVGYTTYQRQGLVIDNINLDLGNLAVSRRSEVLQQAVVTGSRPLMENKIDRIVYNVDKDVTSQGGVATDVLRKIPQVSVDANGNVELLGNPSVLFLINGKKSTIFGNSIVDALQSIPASQIQSIEVMSSPGSKYDATGTGGVINIILKKNKSEGFSGTVNATAGTRQENGSVNLTYKKNNVLVSGYFSGTDQLEVTTHTTSQRYSQDTASGSQYYLGQNGTSDFNRYGYRSGLNFDWDISSKNNLAISFAYNEFGNSTNGLFGQQNTATDKGGSSLYDKSSSRSALNKLRNSAADIGLDYTRKFHREKEQLTFSFQYSYGRNHTSYDQSQRYTTNDSIFSGSSSTNPGLDKLTTLSLDYACPVSKGFLLEMGAKSELESLVSDANVYTFDPAGYAYAFDTQQSYNSTFRRQVYAGYVSASFKLANWLNVIAGLREEYTVNKAWYSNSGHVQIPDYNNLAPSLTLARPLAGNQTIKLSYAYRLERPEYRDLNPFLNLADPQNIVTGNPDIRPEIGHDFQLGYNYNFGKDNNLNIVLVYTHNRPDIKSYTTFYPVFQVGDSLYSNVNVTRRDNIASEDRWGLVLGGSFSPFSKFTIRPTVQLYERSTDNIYSLPQHISGFEYRWNINANYQFAHGLIAEAFGNYRSGIRWQGRTPDFLTYTLALRQLLWGGKGSLGLVAVNAFANYLTQHSTIEGTGFHTDNRLEIPYRSFGISFLYKFGGFKISKPKEEDYLNRPPVEN